MDKEEFLQLLVEKQLGIHLDKGQRRFFDSIRGQRVHVTVNKKSKDSKKTKELTASLSKLKEIKFISSFEIVYV